MTAEIPQELIADWQLLSDRWRNSALEAWRLLLPEQFASGMSVKRYGDIPRWRTALAALPELRVNTTQFDTSAVGCDGPINTSEKAALENALRGLHPWRKGPFELFDITIDTEWRSDWKWQRLLPGLKPLVGQWLPLLAYARCGRQRGHWYRSNAAFCHAIQGAAAVFATGYRSRITRGYGATPPGHASL